MTEIQKQIISFLKKLTPYVLEGNREYFSKIQFCCKQFFLVSGDTMTKEITSNEKISENEVIVLLKEHFQEYYFLETDEEILNYFKLLTNEKKS